MRSRHVITPFAELDSIWTMPGIPCHSASPEFPFLDEDYDELVLTAIGDERPARVRICDNTPRRGPLRVFIGRI